jgi:hypothetical protein
MKSREDVFTQSRKFKTRRNSVTKETPKIGGGLVQLQKSHKN